MHTILRQMRTQTIHRKPPTRVPFVRDVHSFRFLRSAQHLIAKSIIHGITKRQHHKNRISTTNRPFSGIHSISSTESKQESRNEKSTIHLKKAAKKEMQSIVIPKSCHPRSRFVFWVLIVVVGSFLCDGRQFVSTRLKNSPIGIGISCALKKGSQNNRSSSRNRHSVVSSSASSLLDSGSSGFSLFDDCKDSSLVTDDHQSHSHTSNARHATVRSSEANTLRRTEIPTIVKSKRWGLRLSTRQHDDNNLINEELASLETQMVMPCDTKNEGMRSSASTRGGTAAVAIAAATATRSLFFWENMLGGAISRSVAQTVMHPANTMKTILQSSRGPDRVTLRELFKPSMFKMLTRGAGANFLLSVPHGAVNFAVLEVVRVKLNDFVTSVPFLANRIDSIGPALDFTSSAVSTICCSIVSTPQMMITDNIMAGNYPDLVGAIKGLYSDRGIAGFYAGWWPGLAGKIPSYALTWTFFQQLKRVRDMMSDRPASNIENTIMGCCASATTVCIMIPLDTIKTRLVTQLSAAGSTTVPYKGIVDCAIRIAQEEGVATFYRGLAPRLLSVVPMIGIQFGVYEFMKKVMLQRRIVEKPVVIKPSKRKAALATKDRYGAEEALEEAAMETAASSAVPFPAPHLHDRTK